MNGVTKSPIGYWAFERPVQAESEACANQTYILTLRWNMDWFEFFLNDAVLDEVRTGAALNWLVEHGEQLGLSKIFVEPHLVARLGISSPLIRFQGCRAARHDNHIHIQI